MSHLSVLNQAVQQFKTGQIQQAIEACQTLLRENPDQAAVQHQLALFYAQCYHYTEALPAAEKACQLEPNTASYRNTLGNLYLHLRRLEAAEKEYQAGLALAPNHATFYNNLGKVYYQQGNLSQAKTYYEKALAREPDYPEALFNLALVLAKKELFSDAIHQLKKVLALKPEFPPALSQLAQLYLNAGELKEAETIFKQHLHVQPMHAESLHGLGLIYLHHNDMSAALEQFQTVLHLNPTHPEAHFHAACACIHQGEHEKALTLLMRQLEIAPDVECYFNIGVLLSYQERLSESIEYFNAALKYDPLHLNTHLNLGAIYLKLNYYSKAIEHYQAAQSLKPDDPEINFILTAITGSGTPEAPPEEYLKDLFDQYAPYYEQHLKTYLKYQVPELLHAACVRTLDLPTKAWRIVDVGCGTGLCGEWFKAYARELIGIDISAKMIEAAQQKSIYDQLITADMQEALSSLPASDLIVAGDVFSYLGNLYPLLKAIYKALLPNRHLVFTVEKGGKYPYSLQKNMRYSHTSSYLEEVVKTTGFHMVMLENARLRDQRYTEVEGYLVIAKRPNL
ncbi:MAG TPA: tetratricopeptide repeat protein [Coxiellaceae bacterium]|nr:tetratricopeptide repeat protein [Coxiellaceae bacterium]